MSNIKTLNILTIIFLGLSQFLTGCDKEGTVKIAGKDVELYFIESYETTDIQYQIDKNSVTTNTNPLLYYSDFLSYDSNNYVFVISEESKNRIKNLEHSVHGIPFVFKVGNEIIYTGYFWPSYSSQSCDWIVIDPFSIDTDNQMKVELGYPGSFLGIEIPDDRNASQILDVFRRDNKLIQ
jgi:hypothetical protein